MKKLFAIIFLIAASLSCVFAADRGRKSVAVFVRNDSSDPALDSTLKTVANLVSASINNAGFAVVDADLALKNLDAYTGAGRAEAYYEISTYSPALSLEAGKSQFHLQRTFHFHGSEYDLGLISYKLAGISIGQLRGNSK